MGENDFDSMEIINFLKTKILLYEQQLEQLNVIIKGKF
jgi:hypothetical protein